VLLRLACAALAFAACGEGDVRQYAERPGVCAGQIEYGGVRYSGLKTSWRDVQVADRPALKARAGKCARDAPVRVWEVDGVPRSMALSADRPFAGELYIAPGQLAVLPRHPLHHAAFGSARKPDLRTGRGCRNRRAVRGRVQEVTVLGHQIGVDVTGGKSLTIRLDARTRIAGPPTLAAGARVRVKLLQCAPSNKPVASAIERL
jgi:hypothetical protein